MPIKTENRNRYPKNWKQIRATILERAGHRCEFCGIENYAIRENGSKVVLTIAHLDHTPEHCEPENLRALCQKCHNTYDAPYRARNRMRAKYGGHTDCNDCDCCIYPPSECERHFLIAHKATCREIDLNLIINKQQL